MFGIKRRAIKKKELKEKTEYFDGYNLAAGRLLSGVSDEESLNYEEDAMYWGKHFSLGAHDAIKDFTRVTFTPLEIQAISDALRLAIKDISETLQVARYNLYGQMNTGDIIDKPNPPVLIHENGILQSEKVVKRCQKTWAMVFIKTDERNS